MFILQRPIVHECPSTLRYTGQLVNTEMSLVLSGTRGAIHNVVPDFRGLDLYCL